MHQLGLDGMPRRVYTYLAETGWGDLNLLASGGRGTDRSERPALPHQRRRRACAGAPPAGDDPWGADTLEWATASPPRPYNFPFIPVVESRTPLWRDPARCRPWPGLRTDVREVLVTTLLDAEPDSRHRHPPPTIWPLLAAVATAVTFITLIFTPWGAVIGLPLLFCALPRLGLAARTGTIEEQVMVEHERATGGGGR